MSSPSYAVPFILDPNGRILPVEHSLRGIDYRCPACLESVIRREGAQKALHFAHHGDRACTGESIRHAAAKLTLDRSFQAWLNGRGEGPVVHGHCKGIEVFWIDESSGWISGWTCSAAVQLPMVRASVDECLIEQSLENGIRPDLLLRKKGRPILGIEIYVANPVSPEKAMKFSIPWVELAAEQVHRDPLSWTPTKHNIPKLDRCHFCLQVNAEAIAIAMKRNLDQWTNGRRGRSHPYNIERIEHLDNTLRRLCRLEAFTWMERTGLPLPGEIRLISGTNPFANL